MTAPTITFGHGWMDDLTATTNYVTTIRVNLALAGYVACVVGDIGKTVNDDGAGIGTLSSYNNATREWFIASTSLVADGSVMIVVAGAGGLGGTTLSASGSSFAPNVTSDGDVITIYGTPDDASDEYVYARRDLTGITSTYRSTTTYSKLIVRWKTSASAANGLQAKITVEYDDATSDTFTLGFSTNGYWAVTSNTLTAAKTVSAIRLVADDNADALATGPHYVYFDFVMQCVGTFTWPYSPSSVEVVPNLRYADLQVPGRIGNITQFMGADNATILLRGRIDTNTGWHSTYGYDEEFFYRMMNEAYQDVWQWFTSDSKSGKVTLRRFRDIRDEGSDAVVGYELEMQEFHTIGAQNKTYQDRFYGK